MLAQPASSRVTVTGTTLADCTIAPPQQAWLAANSLQKCAHGQHTHRTAQDTSTAGQQHALRNEGFPEDREDPPSGERVLFPPSHASPSFALSGSSSSQTVSSGELLPAAQDLNTRGLETTPHCREHARRLRDTPPHGHAQPVANTMPRPHTGSPTHQISHPLPPPDVHSVVPRHERTAAPMSGPSLPVESASHAVESAPVSGHHPPRSPGTAASTSQPDSLVPDSHEPPPLAPLTPPPHHTPATRAPKRRAASSAEQVASPAQRFRVDADVYHRDMLVEESSGTRRLAVGGVCLAAGAWEGLGAGCIAHFNRRQGMPSATSTAV